MDETIIEQIVMRYRGLALGDEYGDHILFMWLSFAHDRVPFDLAGLLIATDEDLLHDVAGVAKNFHLESGAYKNGFWPRYAASCNGACTHTDH